MSKVDDLADALKESLGNWYFQFPDLCQTDADKDVDALIQAVKDECFAYLTCPDCGEDMKEYQHLFCENCGHSEVNEE